MYIDYALPEGAVTRIYEQMRNDEHCGGSRYDWEDDDEERNEEPERIQFVGTSKEHKAKVIICYAGSCPETHAECRVEFQNGKTVVCETWRYLAEEFLFETTQKWLDLIWASPTNTMDEFAFHDLYKQYEIKPKFA